MGIPQLFLSSMNFSNKASVKESVTILSLKRIIYSRFNGVFNLKFDEEEKNCAVISTWRNQSTFYPSKLATYLKYQYHFQCSMAETQLFMEFLQGKYQSAIKLKSESAVFIATWIAIKWKRKNKRQVIN